MGTTSSSTSHTPAFGLRRSPLSLTAALLPLLLLCVTWGIHWHTFEREEVGLDGALSVDLALTSFRSMVEFNLRDVHPPLFYAFLKGWLALGGVHYLTAKYAPIAASALSLALLFQICRRVYSTRPALLAIVLFSLAPPVLFQAPTVRDFSPGLTLSLASVLAALTALHHQPSRRRSLIALTLLSAAGLLTWYFHLLYWGGTLLYAAVTRRKRVTAALAAGMALATPWYALIIPHVVHKLTSGVTTSGGPPALPTPPAVLVAFATAQFGTGLPPGLAVLAVSFWLLTLATGTTLTLRALRPSRTLTAPVDGRGAGLLLLISAIGILEVAVTTLRWSDVTALSRYLLPLSPLLATLVAAPALTRRRLIRTLCLIPPILLLPLSLLWWFLLARGPGIDWSHNVALATVAQDSRPGDFLLFGDRAAEGRYYLDHGPLPAAAIHAAGQAYLADPKTAVARKVSHLCHEQRRIWYLTPLDAPNHYGTEALATCAFRVLNDHTPNGDLSLWLTQQPAISQTINVSFGSQIALTDASYTPQITPGAPLLVELRWVAITKPTTSYSVFVHLKDGAGDTVAQHDSPPELGFSPTSSWIPGETVTDRVALTASASAVPGVYWLHVGLYTGNTRLLLPSGENYVALGPIAVRSLR
ncbi:MAG: glycosyltransferase family 39 protein [Chloroflexi bacterium]|nr:glycosyltransferase family 39 protein [Chloroflexota bacterium]